jgi:uncharacterized protein (TIGR04222 family)
MTAHEHALWQRIETAPLIDADEDKLFVRKLALQNGWTHEFTERCVREYRKFVFLACASAHPVSPSDAVDQVWHLHLTYTQAYWKVFCPEILGKPLHHSPSKGGREESRKFEDWYTQTLNSYKTFFGETPADIWPTPKDKADEDEALHRRVNARRYWIVPKPAWLPAFARSLGVLTAVLLVTGCSYSGFTTRWNIDGPAYLGFYATLIGAAVLLCRCARRKVTDRGGNLASAPNLSLYEAAFLAGGARRLLQAMVVRFHEAGVATLNDDGKKVISKGVPEEVLDEAETEAAKCLQTGEKTWDEIREALQTKLTGIQERLERTGLLVRYAEAWKVKTLCFLTMGMVLAVGALRLWHGVTWGKPFYFLLFFMAVALGLMIWLMQGPFRTRAGDQALEELQTTLKQRGEKAFDGTSVLAGASLALAVGLLGLCAVRGTPLEKLESKLGPESGGGCGGGCGGSSCGGGGCGGGGCGGCGG